MARVTFKAGDRVRLRRDIITRGGVKFRAGLVMRVNHTEGEIYLSVTVRAKTHSLVMKKKDAALYLEAVSGPRTEEAVDVDRTD